MLSPEEAFASSYITFAVLNRFIYFEKDSGWVSLRGKNFKLVI